MWNWENGIVGTTPYYSRVIASWTKVQPGRVYFGDKFKDWMRSIGIPEEDVQNIYQMATNGKMELEASARVYLKEHS